MNPFEKELQVPLKIKSWIDNKAFTVDDIGMSGNLVLIFEDMVLKIEDSSTTMTEQVQMMRWLEGKLPVPMVLAYEEAGGKSYLLMSKMPGEMSCDTYYLEHPSELLEALACGLKLLWEVDVRDCPRVRDLDAVLKEARMNVEHGLVDLDNVNPDTQPSLTASPSTIWCSKKCLNNKITALNAASFVLKRRFPSMLSSSVNPFAILCGLTALSLRQSSARTETNE